MSLTLPAQLSLPATSGHTFSLSDSAKPLVLYFYPKDNTPGCTNESMDFRDAYADFVAAGCQVWGLSRDSIKSHENFKAKLSLPFDLISDPDEIACAAFGVMKLKNMYGKQVRGIERSTFVLGEGGSVLREWRGVKVPSHVAEVLAFVNTL
ncbi:peroxiredoxin [Rivihabitans pingtungensis]|uniref:peroxiredoxin n=1 Tax=Rivihabitans pingtungensis TaxID=1054498 RepID=UPI002356C207|nr:peroxiredoxin [Rivihabitans pingtungensis]MCK6436239.1 peroxiredoxin [Rivihabitans pingtungensis]